MDGEYLFPRELVLEKAGVTYIEEGPNIIFINIVLAEDKVKLILSIDQDDFGSAFSVMTHGKIIASIPLLEALEFLKDFEDQLPDE